MIMGRWGRKLGLGGHCFVWYWEFATADPERHLLGPSRVQPLLCLITHDFAQPLETPIVVQDTAVLTTNPDFSVTVLPDTSTQFAAQFSRFSDFTNILTVSAWTALGAGSSLSNPNAEVQELGCKCSYTVSLLPPSAPTHRHCQVKNLPLHSIPFAPAGVIQYPAGVSQHGSVCFP